MNLRIIRIRRILFKCIRVIGRLIYRRRIWLISDRSRMADDNGEAFFKFLKQKDVDAVFAISKTSPDYDRIKEIGEVVQYDSIKHKFLLCVSECHCSSHLIHMENHVETPQIFLQHGLLTKNMSKMLNVASHNNFYIVTGSEYERDSICGNGYTIDPSHVWLTGFPRFDFLKSSPKKKIAIALTWRPFLNTLSKDEIIKTDFIRTIVELMNNEQLIGMVKSFGYELVIKLHPEMVYLKDIFPENQNCSIYTESYNKLYEESNVMITDYSSAIYDFAYLEKPVLLFHFDEGEYFKNNPYLSYGGFDYEQSGLGPVTHTIQELSYELKKLLENGCVMEDKYLQRKKAFFAFNDHKNSERVYQRIKGIIKKT